MPLYEYQCDQCGHRFEVIQKFSDPPLDRCPKCGGPVHKLLSAPAFQFKGSGWYITDYAKKDATAAGGDKKPAEKPASSDGKTDTAKDGSKDSAKTTASPAESRPPDTPKTGSPGRDA